MFIQKAAIAVVLHSWKIAITSLLLSYEIYNHDNNIEDNYTTTHKMTSFRLHLKYLKQGRNYCHYLKRI